VQRQHAISDVRSGSSFRCGANSASRGCIGGKSIGGIRTRREAISRGGRFADR
jgi:hypothetical protein